MPTICLLKQDSQNSHVIVIIASEYQNFLPDKVIKKEPMTAKSLLIYKS